MNEFVSKRVFDLYELTIRQLTKADLPALEWDGEFQKYRRMYARLYRDTRAGRVLMWVVENPQGEFVGQVFVMLVSSELDTADGKNCAYVFAFRVKTKWRNQGIGQHLMRFVETDLRERGFKVVTLNVAKENLGAIRLYRGLGYSVTGSRPGVWSYKDHEGKIRQVNKPSWRMVKELFIN